MDNNYQTPSIQIIQFGTDICMSASIVVYYPWQTDEDFEFFE